MAYHHGDLKPALLEAAGQLVAAKGPAGVTLRAVAKRVGVSHAAPYRHFADKEALLAGLATEGFRRFARRLDIPRSTGSALDRVEALGRSYVAFAVSEPQIFRLMFGHEVGDRARHPELLAAAGTTFMLLVDAIADAQAASEISAGSAHDLARVAWCAVHGLASLVVDGLVREEEVARISEVTLRTLREGIGL